MTPEATVARSDSERLAAEPRFIVHDFMTLDQGERITLARPNHLSRDDVSDIEEWLTILLRVMKRSVIDGAMDAEAERGEETGEGS